MGPNTFLHLIDIELAAMVSLWGSGKRDDDSPSQDHGENGADTTASEPQPNRNSEEANEQTRLLPRRERGAGYLSPDDPAVCCEQVKLASI